MFLARNCDLLVLDGKGTRAAVGIWIEKDPSSNSADYSADLRTSVRNHNRNLCFRNSRPGLETTCRKADRHRGDCVGPCPNQLLRLAFETRVADAGYLITNADQGMLYSFGLS